MRNKILMTLALLLTAVTGAWAQDKYTVQFKANGNTKTVENITLPHTFGCNWDDELGRGTGELDVIIQELYGLDGGTCASNVPESDNASVTSDMDDGDNQYIIVNAPFIGTATVTGYYFNSSLDVFNYSLEISIPGYTAEPAIEVKWDPATKTGNFVMPAFDVEIAPIYAPVAQWAKVENVDQLPTAIEGIFAESTDAIVTAGTVAKIGETENVQGTVMYAVGTSATEQPALTAFSADVPTATEIKTAGDVYVWYYIKGADTPEGDKATAENTFNDSEICTEPIKVTVLSNKFDITFKAANDNTIETGKATVTANGEQKTVTEGKLEGVKMGSEVKVTAKDGYKFRKVEAKKGGPTTTVTWNSSDFYFDANPYTKDGVTLTPSNDMAANGNNLYQFGDNTFTTTLGKFIKIEIEFESTTYTFDGWTKGTGGQYQPDTQTYPDWWKDLLKLTWTGNADSVTIKGKDVFGIHSITFTIQ